MEKLFGACVVAQSGGPSAVINSSVYGAIKTALENDCITEVYGAVHGIQGILDEELCDMGKEDPDELRLLKNTPASALGSCRVKLPDYTTDDKDYRRILEVFKKYNIRYFFYNGGNDSMDTCSKVSSYMKYMGYDCRIMGIPKTVDNDLDLTDHCPGYGSSAKYLATSIMEVCKDISVYRKNSLVVFEIMGRNAGWLTASASLASYAGYGPDFVYLPEKVFDIDEFARKVIEVYKVKGTCSVAVAEGVRDKSGRFVSEYGGDLVNQKDAFGHSQMGGLANYLVSYLKSKDSCVKARAIEFSLLQRCASHSASYTDVEEAFAAGEAAVKNAVDGITDKMIGFEREYINGKYSSKPILVDLKAAANAEKTVPLEWIKDDDTGMTDEYIKYALPLIQGENPVVYENGLPRFAKLKLERVIK